MGKHLKTKVIERLKGSGFEFVPLPAGSTPHKRGVYYCHMCAGVDFLLGAMDSANEGRKYKKRIVVRPSRFREGLFELSTFHFPKYWPEACVANRELIKEAQRRAHALEKDHTPEGIEWCGMLGRLLGCGRISVLYPQEHDRMIAFVSQLTHCIAVSLMTCSDNTHLADYTGDSFRDLTRIARINDKMWSELFMMNREPLLEQMDIFLQELQNFRGMLAKGDTEGMREKMRLSTERRAMFDKQ